MSSSDDRTVPWAIYPFHAVETIPVTFEAFVDLTHCPRSAALLAFARKRGDSVTSIRILGPVQAWRGERLLQLGGPRQLTLFAYLVLHANRAVSSDAVVDAVWGPARSNADNRLQMAIARLRRSLEPLATDGGQRLQTVRGGYLLTVAPGELDADVFHSAVHSGMRALEAGAPAEAAEALRDALTLWRGPPLAEVAFEDFAQGEIRRLEELRIRALEVRIDADLQLGRHAELIGELEGLLAEAPTREHLAGQLMLALYRCGRQSEALDVYQRIRASLSGELGLEPGPALKALQTEILEQSPSLSVPGGEAQAPSSPVFGARVPIPVRLRPYGPSVFAGRRRERAALDRSLSDLAASGRQAAFVTGEPGIGKTRLVSEFAHDAHAAGAVVLAGRCDDGLSLPYQPFAEALDHLVAHAPSDLLERHTAEYGDSIARLVPALAAHTADTSAGMAEPSESERYVLFRAIEGLLAAACDGGPVLLVLEDLHWAELPTVTLLRRLLTSPRSWPLMLLATCRFDGLGADHPLRELLADVHREPDVLRLDLAGLDPGDVAELLGGIGDASSGTVDQSLADTLQGSTNGNPFFITELVRGLAETGAIVTEDGQLRLSEGVDLTADLPVSISETLARRLQRMPDAVQRCLGVAAVAGDEFELDLVARVVGAETAQSALELAADGAMVIEVPGLPRRFRFTHALMQRFLYRRLGSARQTELHRQIALAMEGHGGGASQLPELARHWVAAVDADVETAVRYSALAGDDALEKLAPQDARTWYECALDMLSRTRGESDPLHCELLIKRGESERQAGDRRFRETLLQAVEIAARTGDGDRLVRAALGNTRGMQSETGIVDEARIATLDSALRVVGRAESPERARLLAMQAAELMYSGQWERRLGLSDEALAIARRLGDPDALSSVLNMRFVTLLAPETLPERLANTIEAVAVAERLRDPLVRFYAYHWRSYACIEAGDVLSARSWAAREQDIADRFRQPTTLWLRRADEANLAIIAGELEQAAELAADALEIGRRSEPDALTCYAAQQTSIAYEVGRLGELVPLLRQTVNDNPGVPGFRATLALALSESGSLQDGRELLAGSAVTGFADVPYDVTWLTVMCIYAHVAVRLGERPAAATLYRLLEPWSAQIALPAFGAWGPVSLYLGRLASVLGDAVAAERHLTEAARAAIRAGAPIWEAHAVSELGGAAESA
jgi:DNA-binding SARP family transcriptional activator